MIPDETLARIDAALGVGTSQPNIVWGWIELSKRLRALRAEHAHLRAFALGVVERASGPGFLPTFDSAVIAADARRALQGDGEPTP